jgi:hypothetical protein
LKQQSKLPLALLNGLMQWVAHKSAEPTLAIPTDVATSSEQAPLSAMYRLLSVVLETLMLLPDAEYVAISEQLERAMRHSLGLQ